jgi:GNAT superfamily N-acetyltransferase
MPYEATYQNFLLSDDKTKLQLEVIYNYLSKESYWAQNIPLHTVKTSIEGSCCFGIYDGLIQIGFARVVSDKATFGYLADVFVLESYRGKGLSKALMGFIMAAPYLQGLRRMMLATKDAQGLYKQFGFNALAMPERIMEIKFFEAYQP